MRKETCNFRHPLHLRHPVPKSPFFPYKRTLWLAALLRKETCNIRYYLHLCHSGPLHIRQMTPTHHPPWEWVISRTLCIYSIYAESWLICMGGEVLISQHADVYEWRLYASESHVTCVNDMSHGTRNDSSMSFRVMWNNYWRLYESDVTSHVWMTCHMEPGMSAL